MALFGIFTEFKDGYLAETEIRRMGVRVAGSAKPCDSVTVTKKSGETQSVTIGRVVWTGDGVTLATVGSTTGGSSRQSRGGNVCAECGRCGALVADLEDGLMKHYNCCDIPPSRR